MPLAPVEIRVAGHVGSRVAHLVSYWHCFNNNHRSDAFHMGRRASILISDLAYEHARAHVGNVQTMNSGF